MQAYHIIQRMLYDCRHKDGSTDVERFRSWLERIRDSEDTYFMCNVGGFNVENVFEHHDYWEAAKFLCAELVGMAEPIKDEPYIRLTATGEFFAPCFGLPEEINQLKPEEEGV